MTMYAAGQSLQGECLARVGKTFLTFPCTLPKGHSGPHYAIENRPSVDERKRWEAEQNSTAPPDATVPVVGTPQPEAQQSMKIPKVVGVGGWAKTGKDAFATFLCEDHGFTRLSFGDALKEAVWTFNPIIGFRGGIQRLHDLCPNGWDDTAKDHPEVRRNLQVLATEVARDLWSQDFWVDRLWAAVFGNPDRYAGGVVIADARFRNEIASIRNWGGITVRIERPGVTAPPFNHRSETEGNDPDLWDHTISNDGTLDDLRLRAADLISTVFSGRS